MAVAFGNKNYPLGELRLQRYNIFRNYANIRHIFLHESVFFCTFAPVMRRFLLYIMVCACALCAYAQVTTTLLDPSVRTLTVHYVADPGEATRPFLTLQDGVVDGTDEANTLLISFDEMSHTPRFYSYRVEHLDMDGRVSDILSSEYLRGFPTLDITDYETSLNTSRDYTHYRFVFPNADMQLTLSGRYRLSIYEDGDPDRVVATTEFCVVEPRAGVGCKVRTDTQREFNGRYQQLDLMVGVNFDVREQTDIRVVVQQNNRLDNMLTLMRPSGQQGEVLYYRNMPALIFEAGQEYHHFDAFSTFMAGTGIDRVRYAEGDYHVLLNSDELRQGKAYIHDYDADGRYRVNAERTRDVDTEAEYMWVHWQLPCAKPYFDGTVYVGGDLFCNRLTPANRMTYDAEHSCYVLSALVKQGGYDYQYWFVPKGSTSALVEPVDGSCWQTRNTYTVYVYYRPFGARYDQLISLEQFQ